ncbi:tumor necrosis factor receptor superfamily member 1B [Notolabrus celidotus]|uniref:tumor necrosis factor receptor superfamily member 1B n=1 Tax=Notolabrus celidotus TaxID=1203425 RepID=UPI00148F8088|nr:tumor necrosis factor receptor superfamily member 1B [Notolabrus celidotus]
MVLLKRIIFILTFCELLIHLDANCPKGLRVKPGSTVCVCLAGYYQSEDNASRGCSICTRCAEESGSSVLQECTKETNRKCQCSKGFVPRDTDSSTCLCDKGYGKKNGECLECDDGYFNDQIDSPCKQFKKCNAGVNITGNKISDNICNKESKTYVTTTATSNKTVSLTIRLTPQRSHEGAETQRKPTTDTTITFIAESTPGNGVIPKGKGQSLYPSGTDSHIGVILLTCVISLLILTAVICKLFISPRRGERKTAVQTQDSLCGRPVEESGDGSQSSPKQYPEEP